MPQTVTIASITSILLAGEDVTIKTAYDPQVPIMYAFISEGYQIVNGVEFLPGELGIYIEDAYYPDAISFSINEAGELIATGDLAAYFEIDEDGQLQFDNTMATLNLGTVKSTFVQTTPPTGRTDAQWIDSSLNPPVSKYYDSTAEAWVPEIDKETVELSGASLQHDWFIGKTEAQIKRTFRLFTDGTELITKDSVTLDDSEAGILDLGWTGYSGNAYLSKLGNL